MDICFRMKHCYTTSQIGDTVVLKFTGNRLSERLWAEVSVMTLRRPTRLLMLLPAMFLAFDALLIDGGWLTDRIVICEIRLIITIFQIWERLLHRVRAILINTAVWTHSGVRACGGILGVRAGELWICRRIIRSSEWCSLPSQVDLTMDNGRV